MARINEEKLPEGVQMKMDKRLVHSYLYNIPFEGKSKFGRSEVEFEVNLRYMAKQSLLPVERPGIEELVEGFRHSFYPGPNEPPIQGESDPSKVVDSKSVLLRYIISLQEPAKDWDEMRRLLKQKLVSRAWREAVDVVIGFSLERLVIINFLDYYTLLEKRLAFGQPPNEVYQPWFHIAASGWNAEKFSKWVGTESHGVFYVRDGVIMTKPPPLGAREEPRVNLLNGEFLDRPAQPKDEKERTRLSFVSRDDNLFLKVDNDHFGFSQLLNEPLFRERDAIHRFLRGKVYENRVNNYRKERENALVQIYYRFPLRYVTPRLLFYISLCDFYAIMGNFKPPGILDYGSVTLLSFKDPSNYTLLYYGGEPPVFIFIKDRRVRLYKASYSREERQILKLQPLDLSDKKDLELRDFVRVNATDVVEKIKSYEPFYQKKVLGSIPKEVKGLSASDLFPYYSGYFIYDEKFVKEFGQPCVWSFEY